MSVVPPQEPGRPNRPQEPWDTVRTTMRGLDSAEIRATLERVAADYRVLQLQNASLQQQIAELEAVLEAYQRAHAYGSSALTDSRALQRAHSEAREILKSAYAQAEETMARVAALTKAAGPLAKLEGDQKNFQVLLTSTVSELMAILNASERNPYDFAPPAAQPLLPEASPTQVAAAPIDAEPIPAARPVQRMPFVPRVQEPIVAAEGAVVADEPAAFVQYESPLSLYEAPPVPAEEPELNRFDRVEPAPRATVVPFDAVPRPARRGPVDPMDAILKELDRAMGDIPTLRRE